MAGVEQAVDVDGRLRFRFDRATVRAPDLISEVARRYPIVDLSIVEPELETVVRRLYAQPDEAGSQLRRESAMKLRSRNGDHASIQGTALAAGWSGQPTQFTRSGV